MKVIHAANELGQGNRKVCLAIGVFDGVHLGHQQIIRQTVADARQHGALSLVVTFDCHPHCVVAPDKVPPLIYSPSQKQRAIETLGVDALLEIHFDRPFSEQPGERFVRELARDLGRIQSVCVGADFVFGHRRSGNVALLRTLAPSCIFRCMVWRPWRWTARRSAAPASANGFARGIWMRASQMLGRPYALCGRVVAGDRIGRQLGFPTANLEAASLVLPPNGVYAAVTRSPGRVLPAPP